MSHPTGTVCPVIAIGAFLAVFVVQLPVLAVLTATGLGLLVAAFLAARQPACSSGR